MSSIEATAREAVPQVAAGIIDGEPCQIDDSHRFEIVNPASSGVLTQLAECDPATVDRAVRSAHATFEQGEWSRASVAQRGRVLRKAAGTVRSRASELAALDSLSTGLLYHGSMLHQVEAAARWLEHYAALAEGREDQLFRQLPGTHALVTREPVGVAGLFTPWNIPLLAAAGKLGAALASGNSCVIKPSEQSPLASIEIVRILHEAGVPTGALHLVNGRGAVTGAALSEHALVGAISFTGGETAGRIISTAAAQRFAKVAMELGGKSANIVFEDADFERALDGSLLAIYGNSGQACLAGSRILVQRSIADRFIADFTARAEAIPVGSPFDPASQMGPQSSHGHMERVLAFADTVADDGGEVVSNRGRLSEMGEGAYIAPIVVRVPDNRARVCQEEIFGPFATFLVFEDEAEAVALANDTRFGLAGYVWTENLARAHRVADALRTGHVLVNTPMQRELNAPFGGFGHSGTEREGGRWSLDFFSESKTTVVPFEPAPIPRLGIKM